MNRLTTVLLLAATLMLGGYIAFIMPQPGSQELQGGRLVCL